MIKSCLVASAIAIGLAGYALAQETTPGSPMRNAPMTQEPGGGMVPTMSHRHVVLHHHVYHHHYVYHPPHMRTTTGGGAAGAPGGGAAPHGISSPSSLWDSGRFESIRC